jgi:hypothetical protein
MSQIIEYCEIIVPGLGDCFFISLFIGLKNHHSGFTVYGKNINNIQNSDEFIMILREGLRLPSNIQILDRIQRNALAFGEMKARDEIVKSIMNKTIYANQHTINYLMESLKIRIQIVSVQGIHIIENRVMEGPIVNVFYRPGVNEHYNAFVRGEDFKCNNIDAQYKMKIEDEDKMSNNLIYHEAKYNILNQPIEARIERRELGRNRSIDTINRTDYILTREKIDASFISILNKFNFDMRQNNSNIKEYLKNREDIDKEIDQYKIQISDIINDIPRDIIHREFVRELLSGTKKNLNNFDIKKYKIIRQYYEALDMKKKIKSDAMKTLEILISRYKKKNLYIENEDGMIKKYNNIEQLLASLPSVHTSVRIITEA